MMIKAETITIGVEDLFTIKYDRSMTHIAGITTATGADICGALGNRALQTGHSFDKIEDAFAEAEALPRSICRVCWVAATLIMNRDK